jgi:predicted secreted hydrolase
MRRCVARLMRRLAKLMRCWPAAAMRQWWALPVAWPMLFLRYLVVVFGVVCCARAAGPGVSELDVLHGVAQTSGFTFADAPRAFEFPRDHGPHPDFRHEWWYVTGNLDSAAGERFGFELTIFRFALAPPGGGVGSGGVAGGAGGDAGAAGGVANGAGETAGGVLSGAGGGAGAAGDIAESAWRASQVYAAHFAITDVARGKFEFGQKYGREALGLAGAQAEPFRVWLDDWMLGSPAAGEPIRAAGGGTSSAAPGWKLYAQGQGYELSLDTESLGQPVLNGDHGLSRKASDPGAASYYYSIPRVAVHGKIVRAGVSTDVKGLAWVDREWGSGGSLGTSQQGWDWFALQLQDGSALMFYSLRNLDGTRDLHSAGTWVDMAGQAHALSTDQVVIDVSDHWASPRGGQYPSRWRVRVPSVGLDIQVHPVLADQELGTHPRYWEGAVDVRGTRNGHDTQGRGYVELVGYGE